MLLPKLMLHPSLSSSSSSSQSVTCLLCAQVLSTLYAAENARSDQDRNILEVTGAVSLAYACQLGVESTKELSKLCSLLVVTPVHDALQLLSNNTRRTKVVELSSGTHRYIFHCKQLFIILVLLVSPSA